MARGPGDKMNLQNTDRNLPVASIETPPLDYVHAAFDNYQTINRPLSIKYPCHSEDPLTPSNNQSSD
jgi:hypothetical protein